MSAGAKFLGVILLLAAFLRAATIHYGTNVDEGVYWSEGRLIYQGYFFYRDVHLNKPPLVSLVAAAFFPLGPTPIYPMRAVMLIFSMLGLYACYLAARELLGEKAARAALLILAFEPFSAVWAKYLHTSTWSPWFEAGVVWLLVTGLRSNRPRRVFFSGLVLGLYALNKQSAIFMIPTGIAAWLLFSPEKSARRFVLDGFWWLFGILPIWIPFLLTVWLGGAFPAFLYDIWTAHHRLASFFADHTPAFRLNEWRSIIALAPLLWLLPLGSLAGFAGKRWKEILILWIWFLVTLWGNVFFISHLWRHYLLVCMPPAAMLAGAVWTWLMDRLETQAARGRILVPISWIPSGGWVILGLFMLIGWPKNDWTYPGLTLTEERNLARHVERYCPEPFLLNLTNPALYVWTGKEVPPCFQDGRMTRIPYFMTLAGRGYMDQDDIVQTVEYWKTLPIGCAVIYDRFARQIWNEPSMEPLRIWLEHAFQPPRRIGMGDSYYGWFLLFERKRD